MRKKIEYETQLEKLDQARQEAAERITERVGRRRELNEELAELLVSEIMGAQVNGRMESIRSELAAFDGLDEDDKRVMAIIADKAGPVRQKLDLAKLDELEVEYKKLAPEVTAHADRYLSLRRDLEAVVKKYNKKYKRVSHLYAAIQEYRIKFKREPLDCDDLPDYKKLYWMDGQTHISLEHLQGRRPW